MKIIFKEMKEKRQSFCHCGLKESWKGDRLCMSHKNELQNIVESRVQYYTINGHRIGLKKQKIPNESRPTNAL